MPFGAIAAAAVGVTGAIVSAKMSSDSAKDQQKYAAEHTFANSGSYDPNKFNYGGVANQAENDASLYEGMGRQAQERAATQADYTGANGYAATGNQDASSQRDAAALMMARAKGQTPSIAQMQADRQMQQNEAAQASQAASARGAAGLALAGQTAATNTANGSAAISAQAQINAAAERLSAEQGANQAYSGLRAGDLASQQQAAGQSQYNAQLTAAQRAQNDQMQLAEQQNAIGVRNSQLQANLAQQGIMSGSNSQAQSAQLAIQQQNSAQQQAAVNKGATTIGSAIQMGSSAMTKAPSSPQTDSSTSNTNNVNATASSGQAYALPREAGGPVAPGQPYLVGEKGPELIVPNRSGTVVPNRLSQALARSYPAPAATVPMAAPEGKELHQSLDGHAFYNDARPATPSVASAAGPEAAPPALMARKKVATPAQAKKMTPDELMAAADREIASVKGDTARRAAEGPAIRRMADGTASNGYNTELTQGAEQAYRAKFGENSDRDYDLRGAFAAGLTDGAKTARAPDGSAYFPDHLPDTYKKPNHETFSDESQYAPMAPEHAGHWNGNQYVPPMAPRAPAAPSPAPGTPPPTPQQASMLHALLGTMTPEQTQVLGQALLARRRTA